MGRSPESPERASEEVFDAPRRRATRKPLLPSSQKTASTVPHGFPSSENWFGNETFRCSILQESPPGLASSFPEATPCRHPPNGRQRTEPCETPCPSRSGEHFRYCRSSL